MVFGWTVVADATPDPSSSSTDATDPSNVRVRPAKRSRLIAVTLLAVTGVMGCRSGDLPHDVAFEHHVAGIVVANHVGVRPQQECIVGDRDVAGRRDSAAGARIDAPDLIRIARTVENVVAHGDEMRVIDDK